MPAALADVTTLSGLAWRYRRRYAVGVGSLFVVDALELAVPMITALIIDGLRPGRRPGDGWERWLTGLTGGDVWALAGLMVAVVAVQGVLRYYWRVGFIFTSFLLARDLRRDYLAKLTTLPLAYYQRRQTGDLLSRASNDVEAVRMFLGIGLLMMADTTFYLLFVPWRLYTWNARLTLWLLIGLPLVPLVTRRLALAIHARSAAVQAQLATLSASAQEHFSGAAVLRSFAREDAEIARFAAHSREYRTRSLALWRVQMWLMPLLLLIVAIEEFLIVRVGGTEVLGGTLTPGQFVAFFMYLVMLTWPMEGLGWVLSLHQRGRASFARLREVFDAPPEIDDARARPGLAVVAGRLEFRAVTLSYAGVDRPALDRCSVVIEAGATVALVGPLGAGKTTLVRLLLRQVEPDAGRVLVDGRDLHEYPLGPLRRALAAVPQETFLFSATIAENIALGAAQLDRARLTALAEAAALDEALPELPHGLDTMLGERGVNLSGGQKQRVALARALAADAPVLVLDDCLNAVDARTEARILAALRTLRRGRTTLMVTHRLTAAREADLILVFDAGRLVARGSHAQLMALRGWYRDTFLAQQLNQALTGDEEAVERLSD